MSSSSDSDFSLHLQHLQLTDTNEVARSEVEELKLKLDRLLEQMEHKPIAPTYQKEHPIARNTLELSKKMERVNMELEDLKKSVFNVKLTHDTNSPEPEPKPNELLHRYDAIPKSIKMYIHEEIAKVISQIPFLIEQHLHQVLEVKMKKPLAERPPWVDIPPTSQEPTQSAPHPSVKKLELSQEEADKVLLELRNKLIKKNRTPKQANIYAQPTFSSRLKNVRYKDC